MILYGDLITKGKMDLIVLIERAFKIGFYGNFNSTCHFLNHIYLIAKNVTAEIIAAITANVRNIKFSSRNLTMEANLPSL